MQLAGNPKIGGIICPPPTVHWTDTAVYAYPLAIKRDLVMHEGPEQWRSMYFRHPVTTFTVSGRAGRSMGVGFTEDTFEVLDVCAASTTHCWLFSFENGSVGYSNEWRATDAILPEDPAEDITVTSTLVPELNEIHFTINGRQTIKVKATHLDKMRLYPCVSLIHTGDKLRILKED